MAYSTVLQERRKALHEQTAQAMEALYAATLDEHYSDLAHHYTRSGNTEKAIEYLHLAGQQAVQRSANVEAIKSSDRSLGAAQYACQTLASAPTRTHAARHSGRAVNGHQSFASPEVESYLYPRPGAVPPGRGDPPALPGPLWATGDFIMMRGEFRHGAGAGGAILDLAQQEQDPALLLEALSGTWAAPYSVRESSARPGRTWSRA